MKQRFTRFLFLFLLCLYAIGKPVYAQSPSTQGKVFYFSFMQNGYRVCNGGGYDNLSCIISSKKNCSGVIANLYTGWSTTFTVTANGITTISIPEAASYSSNSEIIENLGIVVTATDTISLYIANEATNSFDAANVLPVEALGDRHIIQCYPPSPSSISGNCNPNIRSGFVIIATENNTVVDITPTCITANGQAAHTVFTITLNQGQSYQVMSKDKGTTGDLSGSLVLARNCKKIAVFNGNILTGIPSSETNGFDHIFEQAMPTLFWGKRFAITASKTRQGDFCRITALNNNTQIKKNNVQQTIINERATYEFLLTDSSCYLETSEPCAVYLYQATSEYDHSADGDPSMLWITPVEQQVNEITFGTFAASNTINHHYVNIVTQTNDVASVTLNGNSIASQFSLLSGNPTLSFARLTIAHGTHTIRSNTGFTAFVYGFGNVKGYAYSVGSSAIDLSTMVLVNEKEILSPQAQEEPHYCPLELITFRLIANYEIDSITWDFGDGTTSKGKDSLSHRYQNYGIYTVRVFLKIKQQLNCRGNLYDTIQGYIRIPKVETILTDTICKGEHYRKYGFSIVSDTLPLQGSTYTRILSDHYHCDSTVILNLWIMPSYLIAEDTMVVCQHSEVYWRNKALQTTATGYFTIFDSLKTQSCNCDSLFMLILTVTDVIPIEIKVNDTMFCIGDTIAFHIANHTPLTHIQWNGPNAFSFSARDTVIAACSFANAGLYTVKADSVDNCPTLPASLTIAVLPKVEIRLADSLLVCLSDTIEAYCTNASYYRWNTGERTKDIIVSSSGIYSIEASNERCVARDSIRVIEISTLDFPIYKQGRLCGNDSMQLFVTVQGVGYSWNTGDTTPIISIDADGLYTVTLLYNGCTASQSMGIYCPCELWLPNVFTPNNDGINDVFIPVSSSVLSSFSMYIYDRWGNVIYTTKEFIPWNGSINGRYASSGVYYCVVFYSCMYNPDEIQTKQGSITLIR